MDENKFTREKIADVLSMYVDVNDCSNCIFENYGLSAEPCFSCLKNDENQWKLNREKIYPVADAIIEYCIKN